MGKGCIIPYCRGCIHNNKAHSSWGNIVSAYRRAVYKRFRSSIGCLHAPAMYDAVLALDMPAGVELMAFADDLVILVPGTTPADASQRAGEAVDRVVAWMGTNRLQLAAAKTEVVMISRKKKDYTDIPVSIDGVPILSRTDIRYLGVRIHCHLSWLQHVVANTEKATRVAEALARLMRNHSGPKGKKRRLLVAVVNSILRYAAPIWHEGTETREIQRLLERCHKKVVVGAAFAFRTISYEAAAAIAGVIPICRLVQEDARCYQRQFGGATGLSAKQIRAEERVATIRILEDDWDAVGTADSRFKQWTHRVLPDLPLWLSRKHGEVNFHLCQLLSGHGFFRQFLHSKEFASSPDCPECPGVVESPEHVMFACPRFADIRRELFSVEGTTSLTPENLEYFLLRSAEDWSRITEAAERITRFLQQRWNDERAERAVLLQQEIPQAIEEARAAVVRARNDRRNAARRQRRREEREARIQTLPPAPPVSPQSQARAEQNAQYHREYSRQWRARRREARLAEQQSSQQFPPNQPSSRQARSSDQQLEQPNTDETNRQPLTPAEQAALVEEATSGR